MWTDLNKEVLQSLKKHQQNAKAAYRLGENIWKWFIAKTTNKMKNKANNTIKQKQLNVKRYFSKEDIQRSNRYMRRCSTSLIIQKIHVHIIMRFPLVVRSITIKKTRHCKYWWGYREKRTFVPCLGC